MRYHQIMTEAEVSSRERRLALLRAELADKRLRKHLHADTYAENLAAWIEHISQMSDDEYEADRQRWNADDLKSITTGIHLAGRDHHPADVVAGIWSDPKAVRRAMKARAAARSAL